MSTVTPFRLKLSQYLMLNFEKECICFNLYLHFIHTICNLLEIRHLYDNYYMKNLEARLPKKIYKLKQQHEIEIAYLKESKDFYKFKINFYQKCRTNDFYSFQNFIKLNTIKVLSKQKIKNKTKQNKTKQNKTKQNNKKKIERRICGICFDKHPLNKMIATNCRHYFGKKCFINYTQYNYNNNIIILCPICRNPDICPFIESSSL